MMDATKITVIATESAVFAISIAEFWLFLEGQDAMGYGILFIWGLMPISSCVTSFFAGLARLWGARGPLWPILCSVLIALLPCMTFDTAGALNGGGTPLPEPYMVAFGLVVSFAGYAAGTIVHLSRKPL